MLYMYISSNLSSMFNTHYNFHIILFRFYYNKFSMVYVEIRNRYVNFQRAYFSSSVRFAKWELLYL